MIQDICPHHYKNEYHPMAPDKNSFLLCYDGRKVLVRHKNDEIIFPAFEEAEAGNDRDKLYKDYTYLFAIDGMRFYLGNHVSCDALNEYVWEDTQIFRNANPKYMGFAGITGWQLHRWYESHRYCGRCGKSLVKDVKERMLYCPECHNMEYPKICPAVIIAVTHGNRLLMSKYAGREYKKYALLAGFAEIGETIEETVKREVMEEVGLKVKNITYYKSQPWSFTDTLLLGFFCELDGEENITLDREELALAEWFEREEIPVKPDDCSLTNEMMMAFKNGIK
ncbi:NAD(+) diphosphatase [Bariatricus sp. SGI.154]|uniref:NAD(+) diphosphatase n=1 Tax=Bariatricus sp. SGI.154 TaxID=3420549 RepID=UPI003D0640A6